MNDAIEATPADFQPPARNVVIPYTPRKHFISLHSSTKRWQWTVAHRRAGKSVAIVNHLLRAAVQNPRQDPPPRYAYVGPSFAQAKDLVWGYLKYYSGPIPGMDYSESELTATFPNRAKISLYGGATAFNRMRGLYFDGAALDEYPLLHPDAFNSVVRPCLSDYRGFAIVSGTSNGQDHFYEQRRVAEANPDIWDIHDIKVSETDALHPDEVNELRHDMTAEAFEREYMNSFDASVEGAYYGAQMTAALQEGRIASVPWDPRATVMTFWDWGVDDYTSIWFAQRVGRVLCFIDFYENNSQPIEHYAKVLRTKPYVYHPFGHIMPHDVEQRRPGQYHIETIKKSFEGLMGAGSVTVTPWHNIATRINAVRGIMNICHFDEHKCKNGLSALRSYRAVFNEKLQTNKLIPLHNWASHAADAFGTGILSLPKVEGVWGSVDQGNVVNLGAIRRNIKGVV